MDVMIAISQLLRLVRPSWGVFQNPIRMHEALTLILLQQPPLLFASPCNLQQNGRVNTYLSIPECVGIHAESSDSHLTRNRTVSASPELDPELCDSHHFPWNCITFDLFLPLYLSILISSPWTSDSCNSSRRFQPQSFTFHVKVKLVAGWCLGLGQWGNEDNS